MKPQHFAKLPPRARTTPYLAEYIKGWHSVTTESNQQRQIWEDRYKLDRAIRLKYDLPDHYDIEPELFVNPLPASHARHHHRQLQRGEHAAERRANRHKRRAKDYMPSRSSLALFELANDVDMDETELERLRLEEQNAELQRLTNAAAAEVGYIYFVGEMGLLELWRDDFERSNLYLVQRRFENGMHHIGHIEEDLVQTEGRMSL